MSIEIILAPEIPAESFVVTVQGVPDLFALIVSYSPAERPLEVIRGRLFQTFKLAGSYYWQFFFEAPECNKDEYITVTAEWWDTERRTGTVQCVSRFTGVSVDDNEDPSSPGFDFGVTDISSPTSNSTIASRLTAYGNLGAALLFVKLLDKNMVAVNPMQLTGDPLGTRKWSAFWTGLTHNLSPYSLEVRDVANQGQKNTNLNVP